MTQTRDLVTGTGGFIGHHLVSFLKQKGYRVRGGDFKVPEYFWVDTDEFELLAAQKLKATNPA